MGSSHIKKKTKGYAPASRWVVASPSRRQGKTGQRKRQQGQVVGPRSSYIQVSGADAGPAYSERDDSEINDKPISVNGGHTELFHPDVIVVGAPRHTARIKKAIEYNRWNETIPSLVEPYAHLMMVTDMMRNPITHSSTLAPCTCNSSKVSTVALIYMDSELVHVTLLILLLTFGLGIVARPVRMCRCCARTASLFLTMGFFPCSPLTPGLAVHIDVLSFLRELHFTTAPNVSGFSKALESFLRTRYYKLAREVVDLHIPPRPPLLTILCRIP